MTNLENVGIIYLCLNMEIQLGNDKKRKAEYGISASK